VSSRHLAGQGNAYNTSINLTNAMEIGDLFEQTDLASPKAPRSPDHEPQPLLPAPEGAEETDHISLLTPSSKVSSLAYYIKAEVNFLRYPFFALTTRDLRKIDTIRQYQGLWCSISPRSRIEGGRCRCQAMRKSPSVPGVYDR
jgi:hypothetical protein